MLTFISRYVNIILYTYGCTEGCRYINCQYIWHVHVRVHVFQIFYWWLWSLSAVSWALAQSINCSRNDLKTTTVNLRCWFGFQFPHASGPGPFWPGRTELDTTTLQGSSGVHVPAGRGCFSNKRRGNISQKVLTQCVICVTTLAQSNLFELRSKPDQPFRTFISFKMHFRLPEYFLFVVSRIKIYHLALLKMTYWKKKEQSLKKKEE